MNKLQGTIFRETSILGTWISSERVGILLNETNLIPLSGILSCMGRQIFPRYKWYHHAPYNLLYWLIFQHREGWTTSQRNITLLNIAVTHTGCYQQRTALVWEQIQILGKSNWFPKIISLCTKCFKNGRCFHSSLNIFTLKILKQ